MNTCIISLYLFLNCSILYFVWSWIWFDWTKLAIILIVWLNSWVHSCGSAFCAWVRSSNIEASSTVAKWMHLSTYSSALIGVSRIVLKRFLVSVTWLVTHVIPRIEMTSALSYSCALIKLLKINSLIASAKRGSISCGSRSNVVEFLYWSESNTRPANQFGWTILSNIGWRTTKRRANILVIYSHAIFNSPFSVSCTGSQIHVLYYTRRDTR